MARLQSEPIDVAALLEDVRGDGDGAVALFVGTVRDRNAGRRVLELEYHAYGPMAEREMAKIEHEARASFGATRVVIAHRTGRLGVGEISVAIAAASPHRAPAMGACQFAIEALKEAVPIWKKEVFEGGELWIEGPGTGPDAQAPQARSRSSSPSSSKPK